MSGVPLETCWAFNERWVNKFYYKVASCWLFLLSHLYGSLLLISTSLRTVTQDAYMPPYTHWQQYTNEDKIDPNTDNFIFVILHFYNFILVIDTTVQNNDNETLLHFKAMRLIFMNYSV